MLIVAIVLTDTTAALCQTPAQCIEAGHKQVRALLQQPASPVRDAQIDWALDQLFDYRAIAQASLRQHWNALTAVQQGEVTQLLSQIIRNNERRNLVRLSSYSVAYSGSQVGTNGAVRMSVSSAAKGVVDVDYVVQGPPTLPHVVDIVAEGSSTTTNYYRQFNRFLTQRQNGYPYLVQKLKDKIAQQGTAASAQPSILTAAGQGTAAQCPVLTTHHGAP